MITKKHKIIYSRKKKVLPNISYLQFLRLFILAALFLLLPQQNAYSFRAVSETFTAKELLDPPTPAPYPVKISPNAPPEFTAEAVLVVDTASDVTMYQKNPELRLFPASTTKIMTALVALDEYQLNDVITVKNVITEGQLMGLVPDETITVENLLYGILVHSANDAAYALAEHDNDGVTGFVEKMNQKANELHLTDTNFVNPIGFDDPNHYTNASDLARLSLYALKNPTFGKLVGIPQITVSDTSFVYFHPLKNINELLGKIPGVSGVKTGFTEIAGQALVTTAQKNGHKILIVLLRSQDRFAETEQLINWIFANYRWTTFSPNI